jgi:hypothetical protein
MRLSEVRRGELLQKLADAQGFVSVDALIEAALDAVSPAICVDCELVCEMEPDQRRGYCEGCGQNRVIAAPILAGII